MARRQMRFVYYDMRVTSTRRLVGGAIRQRLTNGHDQMVIESTVKKFEAGKTYTIERVFHRNQGNSQAGGRP